MPRFNEIINNFINGEVSPKIYGRSDSEIYKRACRSIKNMVVHPQGGVARRLGSVMDLETIYDVSASDPVAYDISEDSLVVPFIYSKDERYLVIFPANANFSFYKLLVYDLENKRIIPVGFSGGIGAGWTGDSIGAGAVSANLLTDADTLSEIQYTQNGSLLFFSHQDCPPFYIQRVTKNAFYCADFYRSLTAYGAVDENNKWSKWPYMDINVTTTTVTASATTGTITLTASSGIFVADDVGTPFMATNGGTTGAGLITGYTSSTVVTVVVEKTWPGTGAYTTWAKSEWSKTRGYPRSVCFSPDQRLVWGFTKARPEALWASQSGDVFELSNHDTLTPGSTLTADDPVNFEAYSTEANEGLWLKAGNRNLLMGTRGREYSISDIDGTGLPPANVRPHTSYGSEAVLPVMVDDVPVFVQRGFRKLREMIFDYRVEGYTSPEVSYLAEHIFSKSQKVLGDLNVSKIKFLAYQALDNNILWAVDTNGYLYGCTKSRENEVTAFHRHELGGNYGGEFTRVGSICSLPNRSGTSDDLWAVVTRTIDGSSKTTIERIGSEFRGTELHSDLETIENQPIFLDGAKIFRPRSANFWSRLISSGTAYIAGGSTTATTTGTVSYAQGWAYCLANSYVSYDGTSNADFAQVGCVEFEFRFDYESTITSPATLLTITKAAGDNDNLIRIDYTSAGNIVLTIRDSGGSAIINGVTVGNVGTLLNGVSGFVPQFHIELNYSLTVGATRVFINGKQLGSTITSTGTRDTSIDLIRINADEGGTQSSTGTGYRNLRIYNTVQHTADFELFEPNQDSVTVVGLDHLEDEDVKVLADGLELEGTFTVASGAITLPEDGYSTLIVGLPYEHEVDIMPVDAGTGIGSAQGSIKRIDRLMARFRDTAACSYGTNDDDQVDIVFREYDTPITDPIELVTDDKILDFHGDYDRLARVKLKGSAPLPCNITCISMRGVTSDV